MVRFLVEEVGCDVNGMDGEEGTPNFFGTPLNYAAHTRGGREVVRYLLEVSGFWLQVPGACFFFHCWVGVGEYRKRERHDVIFWTGRAWTESADMGIMFPERSRSTDEGPLGGL